MEFARIGDCQKLLGLESVLIDKFQNPLGLESVGNCLDWKVAETAKVGKCQKLL